MYSMIRNSLPGADVSMANVTVTVPLSRLTLVTIYNNGPERLA